MGCQLTARQGPPPHGEQGRNIPGMPMQQTPLSMGLAPNLEADGQETRQSCPQLDGNQLDIHVLTSTS